MSEGSSVSADGFRSFFDNAHEGLYCKDQDGRFVAVNPALVRLLGYESGQVLLDGLNTGGKQLYVDPADEAALQRHLAAEGRIGGFETQVYCGDDTVIWVSESAVLYRDPATGRSFRHGFMEDVSARKGAEWALRESEERFRNIFENSVEGIFQFLPKGRLITANPATAFLLGFEAVNQLLDFCRDFTGDFFLDPGRVRDFYAGIDQRDFVRGFECELNRRDGARIWASLNARAVRDTGGGLVMCEGSLVDITDRKRSEDMVMRSLERLNSLFFETVRALAKTVEIRDPYTAGHQENVADLAVAIGQEMGLPEDGVISVRLAGILHDIGKLYVPTRYLIKPARLDEAEMDFVREHSRAGYEILKNVSFPWPIAEFVLQHHERLDGSGYPQGLAGGDIHPEARIIAVADVVDAMASDRPYRAALGLGAARDEIVNNSGRYYDRAVVEAAMRVLDGRELEKRYSSPG